MPSSVIKINNNAGFSMTIKGYSQTLQKLKLAKDQRMNLQAFLEREAAMVIRTAKSLVPVDTGRLKDSHRVLTHGATGKGIVRVDIAVGGIVVRGRFVNYAAAVHEGSKAHGNWPAMPARPWLASALKAHEAGFKARLRKAIKINGRSL